MDATSVLLVVAAVGVNFGWQPDQRDPQAYEVVVQLEPQLVDALRAGHAVPIDAHIPPGVAPIRKVRVLVGTGDVPRTPLAASTASQPRVVAYPPRDESAGTANQSTASQPIVVRGQDPGWTDDRYSNPGASNSRRYDQLGPTIGVDPIRTAQAPPPLDRVQNAVVETGNTLRSGVEAGIQQANQQLGRGSGGSPSSSSVWAPPPLWEDATRPSASSSAAASSTGPAASSTAWTSIRPDLAPPRLPIPTLRSTDLRVAENRPIAPVGGPSFPSTVDNRAPLHSVLADPAAGGGQSASGRNSAAATDWSDSWGTSPASSPATIGQSNNNTRTEDDARWAWPAPNSGTAGSFASSTPTSGSFNSSTPGAAADDRYSQGAITPPRNADPWADWDPPSATATIGTAENSSATLPPSNINGLPGQPAAAQPGGSPSNPPVNPPASQPTIAYATPASSTAPAATSQAELPWLPLLGTSVGLVGSLAANLFLCMSYADARQKYRALVRKTTHAFQKSAGVAA